MKTKLTNEEIIKNLIDEYCGNIEDKEYSRKEAIEIIINCLFDTKFNKVLTLDEVQTKIIRERLGINSERTPKTYNELAEIIGKTPDTIRMTYIKSMRELRKINFKIYDNLEISPKTKEFLLKHNLIFNKSNNYNLEIPNEIISLTDKEIIDELQNMQLKMQNILKEENIKEAINKKSVNNLYHLDLSVRAYNLLMRNGINTIGKISDMELNDFFNIRNSGNTTLIDIVEKMHSIGLKMSDDIELWYKLNSTKVAKEEALNVNDENKQHIEGTKYYDDPVYLLQKKIFDTILLRFRERNVRYTGEDLDECISKVCQELETQPFDELENILKQIVNNVVDYHFRKQATDLTLDDLKAFRDYVKGNSEKTNAGEEPENPLKK